MAESGDKNRVAKWYHLEISEVSEAVEFELSLAA
jgi:hypothetical protein